MKKSRKVLLILLIILGVFLLAAYLLDRMSPHPDVWIETLDKPVDRLIVFPFSYDRPAETPVWVTQNEGTINRWKNAFRWENAYAICCDEITTHFIRAFQSDKTVYSTPYSWLLSGYHNFDFSWQQFLLARLPIFGLTQNYNYPVKVPLGTDFEKLRQEMEDDNQWFLFKNNTTETRPFAQMTCRFETANYEPGLAFDVPCEYGAFPPDEAFAAFIAKLEEWGIVAENPWVRYNSGSKEIHWREARVILTRALTKEEEAIFEGMGPQSYIDHEGIFNFKTNSSVPLYTLDLITPAKLTRAERDAATSQWPVVFLIDEGE
jgi:hypothetical protein